MTYMEIKMHSDDGNKYEFEAEEGECRLTSDVTDEDKIDELMDEFENILTLN